jgi:hypothetical protein
MAFDEIAFAIQRSNNAAKAANENSRPMAQYALLINGAAASAVIAFLSKDKIDPGVFHATPWVLCSYALGVVFATIAMFCMTESLDYWNSYWEEMARGHRKAADTQSSKAYVLWWLVRIGVALSVLSFALGSATLAYALLHSGPPVSSSCDPSLFPG